MSDNSDMERLLKSYGVKRQEDTKPGEMHPATRRLLQGEVARVYGPSTRLRAGQPGSGAQRGSFFSLFWPRFGLALSLFLALGAVVYVAVWKNRPAAAIAYNTEESQKKTPVFKNESIVTADMESPAPMNEIASAPSASVDKRSQSALNPSSAAAASGGAQVLSRSAGELDEKKISDGVTTGRFYRFAARGMESTNAVAMTYATTGFTLGDSAAIETRQTALLSANQGYPGGSPAANLTLPRSTVGVSYAVSEAMRYFPMDNAAPVGLAGGIHVIDAGGFADPNSSKLKSAAPALGVLPPQGPEFQPSARTPATPIPTYETVRRQIAKQPEATPAAPERALASVATVSVTDQPDNNTRLEDTYEAAFTNAAIQTAAAQPRPDKDRDLPKAGEEVMESFHFSRSGDEIQITDRDGSVYAGRILTANQPTGASRPIDAVPLQRGDSFAREARADKKSEASATPPVTFRASGTNRTLGQFVVIDGRLAGVPEVSDDTLKATDNGLGVRAARTRVVNAPVPPASSQFNKPPGAPAVPAPLLTPGRQLRDESGLAGTLRKPAPLTPLQIEGQAQVGPQRKVQIKALLVQTRPQP